jgi:hypothetical protein
MGILWTHYNARFNGGRGRNLLLFVVSKGSWD